MWTYLTTNAQKVRDRPKQKIEEAVPNNPIMSTGFRPMRSDALLH